jgi:hypothetical protein
VTGRVAGLTAGPSGDVILFTATGYDPSRYRMWKLAPSGTVTSVPVPALHGQDTLNQVAAAPDGSVYVAAGSLWRVTADGRATEVVRTTRHTKDADDVPAADFRPFIVEGVTVAADGTVYVVDLSSESNGLRVHHLTGGRAVRVAGAPYDPDGSQWRPDTSDPFPARGVVAKSAWIPLGALSGPIAWSKNGLYMRTDHDVVRITDDGRMLPVVAQRATGNLNKPSGPYRSYGKAIDGYMEASELGTSGDSPADLAVNPADGSVFYGAGPHYAPPKGDDGGVDKGPMLSRSFTWHGDFTAAQRSFVHGISDDQTVYRAVPGGDLAAVLAFSKAVAISPGYAYVAEQSCTKDDATCADRDTRAAVVRTRLPGGGS